MSLNDPRLAYLRSGDLPNLPGALCVEIGEAAFFPEPGESTVKARAVCGACPVRDACLTFALENDERFGMWGGTTPTQRKKMRRNR